MISLVLAGIILCAASGVRRPRRRSDSQSGGMAAALQIVGGVFGLAGCVTTLFGAPSELTLPWLIPGGAFHVRLDALSAFFAAPVFLLTIAGALYAQRYLRKASVSAGFGLMTGSLALMMIVANTILFIAAWEIVAVTAFLLVATEHEKPEARRAAWIYLAASHVATLALFGIVVLLHGLTSTWAFAALPAGTGATAAGRTIFFLSLVAFGIKAGLMPFHVWLPGAHAAAPSHVSAVLSGVVIKMGIYGLVRVLSLYDAVPAGLGATVLLLGIVSSIFGVAFALAQHDLKRLLAYHSIENIGIIVTGIGIGLIGQAHGMPAVALLGYAGALLHVWNHSLFKALLFLSGGAAVHAVHTREIDRMGGLGKAMPWTSAAFLTGAAAIAGLPPLNGFVSEWLLYVAGFTSITAPAPTGAALLLILVVPALALTGALALACFVKAFGAVFLGAPRTKAAAEAVEAPLMMRLAMLPLVVACVAIGLLPALFAPLLGRVLAVAVPALPQRASLAATLQPIQTAALVLAAIVTIAVAALVAKTRGARRTVTWDCGYDAPTARMQYTSSSLARGLVGFFAWAMPPVVHAPKHFPLFPSGAQFESHVPDTVLDRAVMPLLRRVEWLLAFARYLQRGRMQLYLVYIGATLIVLLAWSATR